MRILIIPDTQLRPDDDISYIGWIAKYIVKMKPDVIVQIGDWADMSSLSSHDKPGSKSMEGQRYLADIKVANSALEDLMIPINLTRFRLLKNKKRQWNPRIIVTLGNHENRIDRAIANDPKLDGLISTDDIKFKEHGFEVFQFLEPVVIEGVAFSHYYPTGAMGRPAANAQAMVNKLHMSAIAGHQQGRSVAYGRKADGTTITCLVAGSCYLHDEHYMDKISNQHWRGLVVLNEVSNGQFDEMFISLNYLEKKYGDDRKEV